MAPEFAPFRRPKVTQERERSGPIKELSASDRRRRLEPAFTDGGSALSAMTLDDPNMRSVIRGGAGLATAPRRRRSGRTPPLRRAAANWLRPRHWIDVAPADVVWKSSAGQLPAETLNMMTAVDHTPAKGHRPRPTAFRGPAAAADDRTIALQDQIGSRQPIEKGLEISAFVGSKPARNIAVEFLRQSVRSFGQ